MSEQQASIHEWHLLLSDEFLGQVLHLFALRLNCGFVLGQIMDLSMPGRRLGLFISIGKIEMKPKVTGK